MAGRGEIEVLDVKDHMEELEVDCDTLVAKEAVWYTTDSWHLELHEFGLSGFATNAVRRPLCVERLAISIPKDHAERRYWCSSVM